MATIAIGAIGKGNNSGTYNEVKYKFSDGQSIISPYAIDALIQRGKVKFDKTIVLLTKGAREESWDMMKTFLETRPNAGKICDVSIKDGGNEEELWDIFDAIVENVQKGDDLYIDITNGLRHLPVLLLIACSYLQSARDVKIRSISYGAFELGVKETQNGRLVTKECDVFELLPYTVLFDWSSGVEAFKRSGDAHILAEQLRKSATVEAAKPLKEVADKLDTITLALELARPEEAAREIKSLTSKLEILQESSKQYARPFGLLKDMIISDLNMITKLSATGLSSIENKLQTQLNLIEWFVNKNRLAIAILLGREWLVSKYMVKRRKTDREIENHKAREDMAHDIWDNREVAPEIHDAFSEVVTARNDIAHVGQSYRRQSAKDLKAAIEAALDKNILKEINESK